MLNLKFWHFMAFPCHLPCHGLLVFFHCLALAIRQGLQPPPDGRDEPWAESLESDGPSAWEAEILVIHSDY